MTKNELFAKVSEFYKGYLDVDKALTLYELHYGEIPEIEEAKFLMTQEYVDGFGYPEYITAEALTYIKELQESGVVNMFQSVPFIQAALGFTAKEAKELLSIYMKDYTKIYYPEELI
jgi:hypothetical protein